jgi:C1A family cysteine protease
MIHKQLTSGWRPDPLDERDFTHLHDRVRPLLSKTGVIRYIEKKQKLRETVDLRPWCSPVQFQGGYNTCTAHVVAGLLEFLQKKTTGKSITASRLFLFKVTKNLALLEGNSAVYLRQTMGTLAMVGVPPERYWPYLRTGTLKNPRKADARIDAEPPAFCYALANEFKGVHYYRLDPHTSTGALPPAELLFAVKTHLAAALPLSLGFPLYPSLAQASKSGKIPFPAPGEKPVGTHAVLAVGYDDRMVIKNTDPRGPKTTGALLFKNSWSTAWGEAGYGWLPYEYVLQSLARDFWTLIKADWIDSGQFQLPA